MRMHEESVIHIFCRECEAYLAKAQKNGETECVHCGVKNSHDVNIKTGCFFITLPVEKQLRDLLQSPKVAERLLKKTHAFKSQTISDILSGENMKKLLNAGKVRDSDITIILNIDGVPIFKSSNVSMWPIQCTVCELPVTERKKNILLSGIWFGAGKPNMTTFLEPLKNEAKILGNVGFQWKHPQMQEVQISKCFFVCSTCDSVARPIIRNCIQFNGEYGCDWCYHAGERVPKGNGHVRCYPYIDPEPTLRTSDTHIEHVTDAVELQETVHGVKGPTNLLFFPEFDVVNSFAVDYMHCVCLGVVRQFTGLWFDSVNHEENWYIGASADVVSQNLLKTKPPQEISRSARRLSERKFWKASEWRSFLLFYSCVVLRGILRPEYFNHWSLLVFGIHILLQENIEVSQIDLAELTLKKFVIMVGGLYGKEHMSFNVHQLCHLVQSVRLWGPLWATSAFSFESNNQLLLNLFSGTQYIPQQVMKQFQLFRGKEELANRCLKNADPACVEMYKKLNFTGKYRAVKRNLNGPVEVFGKPKVVVLNAAQNRAISYLFNRQVIVIRTVQFYKRFEYKQRIFGSYLYSRSKKRDNSFIILNDGTFARIESLIIPSMNCSCHDLDTCVCLSIPFKPYLFVKCFEKVGPAIFTDRQVGISSHRFFHPLRLCNQAPLRAILLQSVKCKCVVIQETDELVLVSVMPNNVEKD